MLIGVMVTYNDWPIVQTAIESIYDKVDRIVAIDGKYADFPQIGKSDRSSDGTLEYLYDLDKVQLVVAGGLIEPEKRSLYLVGDIGDWYLHLDADEEWIGDVQYDPHVDMMITPLKRYKEKRYMDRVRLFRHVPGLRYRIKHYWLYDGNGHTFAVLDRPGNKYRAERFSSTKIVHHEQDRTAERISAKRVYYRYLYKHEGRKREVLD